MRHLLVLVLFICCSVNAEIIDASRRVTWQGNCGTTSLVGSASKTIFTTMSAGSTAAQVQTQLGLCPANQVVVLSSGAYTFSGQVDWEDVNDGVVLRGAGMSNTVITFTTYVQAGMWMSDGNAESPLSVEANLSANGNKGDTTITLASVPSWVTVGRCMGIDALDDTAIVGKAGTSGGESYRDLLGNGDRSLGHLVMVTAKDATTITFTPPLAYAFLTSKTAQIFQPSYDPSTTSPLRNCGIEDLSIVDSAGSGGERVVLMKASVGCYLNRVEIRSAADVPVFLEFAFGCEIRGCIISNPRLLGGGQGYATAIYHLGTSHLIEDNIITGCHNGLTVNYGGAYNVFAYNYEKDGTSDSGQNPGMNTHGVHTYMNLWEGNFCEDKLLADWTHGSSSHGTLFRNRVTGDNGTGDARTCVSIEYYNRYWNVVGNIFGVPGLQNKAISHGGSTPEGSQGSIYKLGGEININNDYTPNDSYDYTAGMFILAHRNYDTVTAGIIDEADVSDTTLPDSLYLSSKPPVFGILSWPPFIPTSPSTGTNSMSFTNIPAGFRFANGTNPPAELAASGSAQTSGRAPQAGGGIFNR